MCVSRYNFGTRIAKNVRFIGIVLFLSAIIILFPGCETGQKAQIPKNIIVMIADGCGYNQVDAANIYRFGKTGTGIYEKFPVVYGMSTYPAGGERYNPDPAWKTFEYFKRKPTDSGASATAMSTGVKTYNGAIAVDMDKMPLETISERAEKLGKSSGVVTSVTFNHATPATFAAHNESRGNYAEIAREMITESALDVIMGCAHPEYDNNGDKLVDPEFEKWGGPENWRKLVNGELGGDADGDGAPDPWNFIENHKDFIELMTGDTPNRVFGLARNGSTLQQGRGGDKTANPFAEPFIDTVPTLVEMSLGAINVLDNDPDGFFLMIEGGAVDWAGHDNQSGRIIEEKIDFDQAIEAVIDWVENNSSWNETMLVITGDHETGYLNGPDSGDDSKLAKGGVNIVWTPLVNNGKEKLPGMEWHTNGHTNQLIPFYAKGAGSEEFRKYAVGIDTIRGSYLDNADLGQAMMQLWWMEKD